MITACVFDLDGTLLDTVEDIATALNRGLAAAGLPARTTKECTAFIGGGIQEAVRRAAPQASPEKREQALAAFREFYVQHCTDKTVAYPGIGEMLSVLTERGAALGVLSNKPEDAARKIMAYFFPQIPFRFVFGQVEHRPLKPNPAAALSVVRVLQIPPEQIAYVGDSGTDMVFARDAGLFPIAVSWGYRPYTELIAQGATVLLHAPDDLPVLVDAEIKSNKQEILL